MATLVLTTVGTLVGGPIGGAVGALIGQAADAAIFAPKARQGPRLGELSVQTSSYGTQIPKLFGTMRVAGTVIWATDLIERRSTSGGGKGRPKTVDYSYSVSFAVALSGRRIRDVGRIWADGKLLRGAGGDFKSATGFRLYYGDEDQAPDPLIASLEGIGETPAFRGIAYALFEDFQLADYGNRIPSLSFELIADAGPVTIGAIARELSDEAIAPSATPVLAGYAATGESVRAALEPLAALASLPLADDGIVLRLGSTGTAETIGAADIVRDEAGGRGERSRRAALSTAEEVGISYYEPARDWQTGLQRATIGGPRAAAERLAVPAALSAGAAKDFAEARLATIRAARAGAKLALGWRHAGLRAGDELRLAGEPGLWSVKRWRFEKMRVLIEMAGVAQAGSGGATANPGRPAREPDLAHGPTTVHLLDLPLAGGAGDLTLLAAAAGPQPGWRRAALSVSHDGGASWEAAGVTAPGATLGVAIDVLAPGGAALIDDAAAVTVALLNDAMWLESRSDESLADGANLALLGDELIQFGRAEPLGAGRFRLSRLVRGRRGTEAAAALHCAGERFVLIEPDCLAPITLPVARLGGTLLLRAEGIGDVIAPAEDTAAIEGAALLPPSPVHFAAERLSNGDLRLSWVRRSRDGWTWRDGDDAPLDEAQEAYALSLNGRVVTLHAPSCLYPAAEQAADGGPPFAISIRQIGSRGLSRPTQLDLSA